MDGCFSGLELGSDARAGLARLAAACAAGTKPELPQPLTVELAEGGVKELPFTVVDAPRCVRALATATPEVRELELRIVDRFDRAIASDELRGNSAVVGRDGPVCVDQPGQYRAIVKVVSGSGAVAFQVYRAD